MHFKTISFYTYVIVENPESLRDYCKVLCEDLQLTGRILIAREGINGAVSGKKERIEEFKKKITQHNLLSSLTFREQEADALSHHKLIVRVRDEIVHFGKKVNVKNTGAHLSPSQLQRWYSEQQDFIIVDARNEYEHQIGKFKNAVTLPIDTFREFPQAAAEHLQLYKSKKLVLYCTGGVRCEKASAYLKEQGFEQVYQIEGGIINYVNQFPNSYWEGGLFVFDDRIVSDVGEPITKCLFCPRECEQYYNCHNLDCDRLFIACPGCKDKMKTTCSEVCRGAPRQRKELPKKRNPVGIIENYYPQAKAASMRVHGKIERKNFLEIVGKTTLKVQVPVAELRDEDGNSILAGSAGQLVTFPIAQKVRRNDVVYACED